MHPFFGHPLFSRYGGMLAAEAKQRGLQRCKEKRLLPISFIFTIQTVFTMERLRSLEKPHRQRLTHLAQEIASRVWGIPISRLDAQLVAKIVLPHHVLPARNTAGAMFRAGIVGFGGVEHRGDELIVVAKATNWQLLAKELVKGTADLICLHGLSPLDDASCAHVLATTDHLDLEPWMLQSGGELWRRLLLVLPESCPIARALMHLARLPPAELMSLLASVIEQRPEATARLALLLVEIG